MCILRKVCRRRQRHNKCEAHRVMTLSRSGTVSRERDAGTEPAEREVAYG